MKLVIGLAAATLVAGTALAQSTTGSGTGGMGYGGTYNGGPQAGPGAVAGGAAGGGEGSGTSRVPQAGNGTVSDVSSARTIEQRQTTARQKLKSKRDRNRKPD